MFERFTQPSRRVVVLAQEEARMLNHNYIGTEHILLGLIHEEEGVGGRAIVSLGLTLEMARDRVRDIIGQGQEAPSGHIPFTPRAKKVLELSLREALALRCDYIGTEHILLGLVREADGVGAQVLARVTPLLAVRERVRELASAGTGEATEEPLTAEWLARSPQGGVVQLSPRAIASVRAEVVKEFRETLATIGESLATLEQRLAGIESRLGITPPAPPATAATADTAETSETAPGSESESESESDEAAAGPDETMQSPEAAPPEESAE